MNIYSTIAGLTARRLLVDRVHDLAKERRIFLDEELTMCDVLEREYFIIAGTRGKPKNYIYHGCSFRDAIADISNFFFRDAVAHRCLEITVPKHLAHIVTNAPSNIVYLADYRPTGESVHQPAPF